MEYPDKLKKLKMPTLRYRRLRGDMIETFKIITGIYDNEVTEGTFCIFNLDPNTQTNLCCFAPITCSPRKVSWFTPLNRYVFFDNFLVIIYLLVQSRKLGIWIHRTFGPVNCEELQDRTRFYRTDNKIMIFFK